MRIGILHLSDLHIKQSVDVAKARTECIARALAGMNERMDLIVVAFSGDLAFSGTKTQFELGLGFAESLVSQLQSRFATAQIAFVAVPGNHDCDFRDSQNQAREMTVAGVLKTAKVALEDATLAQCTTHQTGFFAFLDAVETVKPADRQDRFYYRYDIEKDGYKVVISCFNTAIGSAERETPGTLYVPVENLKRIPAIKDAHYAITIFHHPYNWLTPDAKQHFQAFNEKRSDIVLTGHEHVASHYRKANFGTGASAYIEGAVLAEHDAATEAGFNVILVDLATSEEAVFEFAWADSLFERREVSGGWRSYRRALKHRDFQLTEHMLGYLVEAGMPFKHPAKEVLTLDDIFIAPDAEEFVIDEQKDFSKTGVVKGKNLFATIIERRKAFVIGRERAGKSTLCKVLFREYYDAGFTPVLIEGGSLKRADVDDPVRLVRRQVAAHYFDPKLDLFDQYDVDKTVVIVDDLDHASELGPRLRSKLIEALSEKYTRVVIFGDDLLRIEGMASRQFTAGALRSFANLEIKEFGYVLRSQLIDRWHAIGAEYVTDEEGQQRRVQEAERLIDEIMKRSYLPSYPIFVLTILQGSLTTQNIASNVGSYGYLYQVLITDKLVNAAKEISLERKLGYLVELAYRMFHRRHSELCDAEYQLFHLKYCAEYPPIDRQAIFGALESGGVLEVYDGQYRFKYKYFYYYFVAQYFARHIDEEPIREQIKALCKDFDKEEHANIWLFLTHQSRSHFLLDSVLDYARGFFRELPAMTFSKDVQFLDELYEKVPALVYINKSIDEIRLERREHLDQEAAEGRPEGPEPGAELLEMATRLKAAIRTLEVIGQVVKNFATSLKGEPRYILVKECYDLGLKVVAECVSMWQQAGVEFVNDILDVVLYKDTTVETKEELERAIKGFIFYFCETVAFSMVKRITQAVGSRDLVGTYAELVAKNPVRSYEMIDIAIKLDNPSFPSSEVYSLNDRLSKEVFCKRILSRLVVDHFYIYKTREQLKQQVCSKLGIEMKKFQQIDFKTHDAKRLHG